MRWNQPLPTSAGMVQRVFTDRSAGYSRGPYSGLNLAKHVGDNPEDVDRNRATIAKLLGWEKIIWMDQVHGHEVLEVQEKHLDSDPVASVDAMFTRLPQVGLAVMVADCTPVLLADRSTGMVGVAHAGRPGMTAGVVPALVTAMRAAGATNLHATIGPSICGRCYEVPATIRETVTAQVPIATSITSWGTPAVDVASGVAQQLRDASVPLEWVTGCTYEQENWYSYRRDGRTGRFAGLIARIEDKSNVA